MVKNTFTIERKGRYGVITPIPEGVLSNTILKYCSYERQGAEFMPKREWAMVKLYNVKKGIFPWGLIDRVKNIFDKYIDVYKDCEYNIKYDKGSVRDDIMWNNSLRYYQKEAILSLLQNNGGILSMPTGSGKTMTIIEYLKIMNKKSLVIVTTLDIKMQWIKETEGYDFIDIQNYQNKKLKTLVKDYEIIVFDESHHVSASTIYKLALNSDTKTIVVGCSGTPYREDGEDMRLEAALGNIVYSITRKQLINEGFLSNATIYYVRTSFPNNGKYMDYSEVYKTNIVENVDRNTKIVNIALKESKDNKKVLILVNQIEHGDYLLKCIREQEPKSIFMNGGSEDRNIDYDKYNIIIGSNIYQEGVNIPAMDVLILGGGGKSSIQLTQRIGRVLRKTATKSHATIYDFIDTPKYLSKHYKQRRDLLSDEFEVHDYE